MTVSHKSVYSNLSCTCIEVNFSFCFLVTSLARSMGPVDQVIPSSFFWGGKFKLDY